MVTHWASYSYTEPIMQALTAEFGTEFDLYNTGGGCICMHAMLEGGMYVLIGSGIDGPLWDGEDRENWPHGGGYGVGIYREESGDTLAHAQDHAAETGEDVIDLVKRAIRLVASGTEDQYPCWAKTADGTVTVEMWIK
jgi:hypothetical protein